MLSEARKQYLVGWREKNRDKIRESQQRYYEKNKEICDARVKVSRQKNKQYYSQKSLEWQHENRDRVLAQKRHRYRLNSAKEIERVRRRAGKIRQSELSMHPAELAEVQGMYMFCQIFPNFEVDHIIPLNGKTVSGLHVLNNLQVISRFENRSKGAKFDPIYFERTKNG